jgi:chromosome segregation ATPase
VTTIREREAGLMSTAKQLANDAREAVIAKEKADSLTFQLARDVRTAVAKKEELLKIQHDDESAEGALRMELNELLMRLGEKESEVDTLRRKNEATVVPELEGLAHRLQIMEHHAAKAAEAKAAMDEQRDKLRAKVGKVKEDVGSAVSQLRTLKQERSRVAAEPERLAKQVKSVERALGQVEEEITRLANRIAASEAEVSDHNTKRDEAQAVAEKAQTKLEAHRQRIEDRKRDAEELRRNIREVREEQDDLLRRKREMQAHLKEATARLRAAKSSNASLHSQYERATKELKRRIDLVNGAKALLPLSEGQVKEAEIELAASQREHFDEKKRLQEVMRELDVLTLRLSSRADVKKHKQEELEESKQQEAAMIEERDNWRAEEALAMKQVAALKAARDLKKRELVKIEAEESTAIEETRVKHLTLADLEKQTAEATARLRKVTSLYEAGKQERNALVNAIQAASQALAERKERVKILTHELTILRNESVSKDAALNKERQALQRAAERRDTLRAEANKEQSTYRHKQAMVETQIVTIDRLNALINTMEREMLKLKDEYEQSVEARNFAGVQLIDRNDELCILYEKAAVHDEGLRKGEQGLVEAESFSRALRLRQEELERDLRVARAKFPELPKIAQRVLELQKELQQAAETSGKLSAELEDPAVTERWIPLEGADQDEGALREKVELLEARLSQKREELLERELVLEEITALGDKLKDQVSADRKSTKAQSASVLRGRIRDMARKIVAVVSEMSMWQSSVVRLGEEREYHAAVLRDAEERYAQGHAPTVEGEKMLSRSIIRRERLEEAAARRATEEAELALPPGTIKSHAEPRPNAYIPEDIPIPKPYGKYAPMKPAKAGASMRHIRNPQPAEIEL